MQPLIKITTEHKDNTTTINIDNSTEFKDFNIDFTWDNDAEVQTASIQLDITSKQITINRVKLNDFEVELFKQFINQI